MVKIAARNTRPSTRPWSRLCEDTSIAAPRAPRSTSAASVACRSIGPGVVRFPASLGTDEPAGDRKSTRLNSSHVRISYAVFCLKKKKRSFGQIQVAAARVQEYWPIKIATVEEDDGILYAGHKVVIIRDYVIDVAKPRRIVRAL